MDYRVIILSIIVFLFLTFLLVGILLGAKSKLLPSGPVNLQINGEIKKVIIVIAVVGRPMPITPLTTPATKKAKLTIRATSFELVDISNY